MASLALGIAGSVIGGIIGGPIGASVGYALGSALGGLLDPPKSEGPRLNDLKIQRSQYGTVIPRIWGTVRIAGVIDWQTDLQEHKETSGGKGGPEVTTYSYSSSFSVKLCETEIVAITKIWADGRIIWPVEGDDDAIPITIYYGTVDQLPDPTIEAVEGVGEVSANRGFAYVVFADWYLTEFGNRIPQLEFELSTLELVDEPISRFKENHTQPYEVTQTLRWAFRWSGGPIGTNYPFITQWTLGGDDIRVVTLNKASSPTYIYDPTDLQDAGVDSPIATDAVGEHTNLSGGNLYWPIGAYVYANGSSTQLFVWQGGNPVGIASTYAPLASGTATMVGGSEIPTGSNFGYSSGLDSTLNLITAVLSNDGTRCFCFVSTVGSTSQADAWYEIVDGSVTRDGTCSPVITLSSLGMGRSNPLRQGAPFLCSIFEDNGQYCWTLNTAAGLGYISPHIGGGGQVNLWKIDDANNFATLTAAGTSDAYDPGFDRTGYTPDWSSNSAASICSPAEGYAGVVLGVSLVLFSRGSSATTIPLAEIVADLCADAGMGVSEYDTSGLPDDVRGFMVAGQMEVRNAIDELRKGYFFDQAEVDDQVLFVPRAEQVSIATIADDDLAAHNFGEAPPPLLATTRLQDLELPRMVSVNHIDPDTDYQQGTQSETRQVTDARSVTTVSLAVVLTTIEAKRISQRHIFEAHLQREPGVFTAARKYAVIVPTDIVTVHGREVRVINKTEAPGGLFRFDCVPYLDVVYGQVAEGVPGSGFAPVTPKAKPSTTMLLLNVPMIRDTDWETGFKIALAPSGAGPWTGASAYKSSDGGATYNSIASVAVEDTIGTTLDVLPNFFGGNVFDESSTVTVLLTSGELASLTAAAVLNGANAAVLGEEIIQFKNATLIATNTYTLTGLLRGRRGTEYATDSHSVGERFVLLPVTDYAAPVGELFQTKLYKGVTFGKPIASVPAVSFANMGQAARCYSPSHVYGGTDASGNITINWTRRTRIGGTWKDFADVPLSEAVEKYIVQVWDATYSSCARIIETATTTASYSAANQVTDFGATQEHIYVTVGQVGTYQLGTQTRAVIGGTGAGDDQPVAPVTPYNTSPIPPPGGSGGSVNQTIATYPFGFVTTVGVVVGDTYVVKFTSNGSPVNTRVSVAEYGDPPTFRKCVVATDVNGNSPVGPVFWGNTATKYLTPAASTDYFVIIKVELPDGTPGRPLGEGADLICDIASA